MSRAPGVLTSVERLVAGLAVQGLTAAEIAVRLSVSQRAAGAHLRMVSAKTGTGGRVPGARLRLAAWLQHHPDSEPSRMALCED